MRVCLVSSINLMGWLDLDFEPAKASIPLGLLSLASVLEHNGHQVKIVDFNYALIEKEISLDKNFYASAATKILNHQPECVGFSTTCNSYHMMLRIAEAIKIKAPDILVVFGGPQASVVDVETLNVFPFVDMIIRGEAETSFPRLLSVISGKKVTEAVNGLTYRDQHRVVRFPDEKLIDNLDSLPMPAYHLFPYKISNPVPLDVGRGCPFDCSFCSTSIFWKRLFRLKSATRIINEMQTLKRKYEVNSFSFFHDSFTFDKKWLTRFCHLLAEEKMDITWSCYARIDCIGPQLIQLMAKVGCKGIFYGIETGSEIMQKIIGKNLQLKNLQAIVEATLAAKMDATLSFISGFPAEQKTDLDATINLIQTLLNKPVKIQLHLLGPQVGTREYTLNSDKLCFDGYYSDINGTTSMFLEPELFKQHPKIFASNYFYRTDHIPRDLLKGLDLFINGPCAVMRQSVSGLLGSEGNLINLYYDWRKWNKSNGLDAEWNRERSLEKLLMDFYDFILCQVSEGKVNFEPGHARDEILAFYLSQYNKTPVELVSIKENDI